MEIIDLVLSDQRTIRELSRQKNLKKRQSVIESVPELKAFDDEMISILSSDLDPIEKNKKLKKLDTKMNEKINELKLSEKIKPSYECEICKDTGYVNGKMCRCLTKKLNEKLFKFGESREIIKNATFKNYNLNLFSDEPIVNEKSLRDFMAEKEKLAMDYAENFSGEGKGLFYFGKSGTGKTFNIGAITNRIIERGFTVIYLTSMELFEVFRYKDTFVDNADDYRAKYTAIKDVELLVIDDLGTEVITPSNLAAFFDLVNYRTALHKPVIYSSNLELTQLSKKYDDRVFSRISGSVEFVEFIGKNLRYIKEI